jgi:hypothetical protein
MDRDRAVEPGQRLAVLDRHALVMAVWLPAGFVAAVLLVRGWLVVQPFALAGGFAVVVAGFVGHVIVNAATGTRFTPREVALGLVLYSGGLLVFLLASLFGATSARALFVVLTLGFLGVAASVIFYMVTHFGVRGAFEAFDVIRDFRAEPRRRGARARPGRPA